MIGQENDEKGTRLDKLANFPLKLLLTDKQVADICKAFANNSSTNKKKKKIYQKHSYVKYYIQVDFLVDFMGRY